MNSITDKQLMLQVRDGDLGKLGHLFERHHILLYNFLLRMTGSREISEDLVQDVFLRMLKYRHTYEGRNRFTLWMFQIARNAHIDFYNKRKREVPGIDNNEDIVSKDRNPTEVIEQDEEVVLLKSALSKLPFEDREVLLLSRFQNLKYKEIARLLGVAEGTIKGRVHRAIKNLRDIYYTLSGEKEK